MPDSTSVGIIRIYLIASGLFTLAASLIWAVNTLFLLDAGLDIFTVMVVNAAFTLGQLVFEVPTGVIADTIGRKMSFLIGIGALAVATLLYVLTAQLALGIGMFIAASVLLGFGFTCQTGATDAWLVDALAYTGYDRPLDGVFARGQVVFGIATLVGALGGGFLGQIDLAIPYYARSAILLASFVFVVFAMHDVGFVPRPFAWSRFGEETKQIMQVGTVYGWRSPVVRPLLFTALIQGAYFIFGFYSWQRYFLDLLARDVPGDALDPALEIASRFVVAQVLISDDKALLYQVLADLGIAENARHHTPHRRLVARHDIGESIGLARQHGADRLIVGARVGPRLLLLVLLHQCGTPRLLV